MKAFLNEIKRRKVFRVAAIYLVVSWLLMQIGEEALVSFRLLDYQKTWVLDLKVSCLESGQSFANNNLPEVEELSLYISLV